MASRALFAGGMAFGLLLVAGADSLVPASRAEERPKPVRLLVGCDDATRPKVLEALRGLDVVVHDLTTMERVPLPGAPPRPAAETPLVNAFETWREWSGVVEGVRKTAGPGKTLAVSKTAIDAGGIQASGWTSDAETLDALRVALQASARLGSPRVALGPISRAPDGSLRWDLSLSPPADAAPAAAVAADRSVVEVVNAVRRTGGSVRMVAAARIQTTPAGERRSHLLQLEPGDPVAVARVLAEVAALPGVTVSRVTWVDVQGRAGLTFEVTVVAPR